MPYFEVNNLYYRYEEQWVLEDISFKGEEGELIAIVGPSGCGKTTILKTIVGILSPQQGSIIINSNDITDKPIETRNIGYVPQNQGLFPHLTVFENIAFGLKAQKWKKDDIEKHIQELAKLSGLEDILARKPHEISGGQQQRVALLRALAPFPKLLLLDEPLSNIDTNLREQLAIYIRRIQEESQITTLFVTHDLEEAKMLADKLVVVNQGKVLQIGSPIEVNLNPISIEVATTLGLKNLYKTISIVKNIEKRSIRLISEVGNIEISNQDLYDSNREVKGVYISPTMITISREPFSTENSFKGKVFAVIPEPMVRQVTLLVSIPLNSDKLNKNDYKVLRVQIPSSKCDYQISEIVYVNILQEGIKLYES
ncbi:iron ABC transporter ATP-binding protein [Candidatus Heimdallarchaeota archaeon B3_Heim]|nr:MAG: iron ABC transporter ATP-binding protein [Candidatus Heimdallarchaeota archaeon B3_Heim]